MRRLLTLLTLLTIVLCSRAMPVERVCVVTDRDNYVASDTIRFRAFLLDAATDTKLTDFSQYIYVELIDPLGSVARRVKIKADSDGNFIGLLPLDRELPGGTFTLAAYTWYMQNQGPESFYRAPVQVRSLYSLKYNLDHAFADGQLTVSLTDRSSKRPVQTESLTLVGSKGILADAGRKKSSHTFRFPSGESVVKVRFDNFEQFIAIPADSATYTLEFFPEGGHLIAGQMNSVAIRATDPAGRPVEFSGTVTDTNGTPVAAIASRHEGLELLHIVPQPGVKYQAEVWGRTFPLPPSVTEATSLQIVAGKSSYIIINAIGSTPSGLTLSVSKGGLPVLVDTAAFPLRIPRASLPSGQLLFTLSRGAEELSQRVVSNRVEPQPADLTDGDFAVRTSHSTSPLTLAQEDMQALTATPVREPVTFDYPVEMGGEISGIIRSRWRGKPMKNARINIIAPEISLAEMAVTHGDGRFTVNGIDWPDGTTFACQAIGPNGKREHNFVIETDTFPTIAPLPMPLEPAAAPDDEAFDPLMAHGILLQEIQVTAPMTVEEQQEMAFRAMGIRTFSEDYFAERSVTTYEEALRAFPGLYVEGGNVYSRRGGASVFGGSNQVEIVVNELLWTPSYLATPAAGEMPSQGQGPAQLSGDAAGLAPSKAGAVRTMTGGLLPKDVAAEQFLKQQSSLSDLQGAYPFQTVKSIAYVPAYAAIFVSNSAAHSGGALLITTRKGGAASLTHDLFIQLHRPLGHQAIPGSRATTADWNPRATTAPAHGQAAGFTPSGQFIIFSNQ